MAPIALVTEATDGLGPSVAARLAASIGALRDAKCPGSAVLVSLAAARIGRPNHETVAAAKAGVEGLVRSAAATYAGNGIRINAVAPRHHGHAGRGGHSGQRDGPRGGGSPVPLAGHWLGGRTASSGASSRRFSPGRHFCFRRCRRVFFWYPGFWPTTGKIDCWSQRAFCRPGTCPCASG